MNYISYVYSYVSLDITTIEKAEGLVKFILKQSKEGKVSLFSLKLDSTCCIFRVYFIESEGERESGV